MANPIIPVYLNQRMVFDLVAMLEDGMAAVTHVTAAEKDGESSGSEASGNFGLNNALASLFTVGLSGAKRSGQSLERSTINIAERVHTPASLLYKLREMLFETDTVKRDVLDVVFESGDFIEFKTSLTSNPLVETMDTILGMIELAFSLQERPKSGSKQKDDNQALRNVLPQMKSFRDALKAGNSIDLLGGILQCNMRPVVTVENRYLNDPAMGDLKDGEFSVLGKVIRVVETSDDGVNLLRKSAVMMFPEEALSPVLTALGQIGSKGRGYNLPANLETKIQGPAIHVIPIAIFA